MPLDQDSLIKSFRACISQLGQLAFSPLVPTLPGGLETQGEGALKLLCKTLGAEAASLFLVSNIQPDELRLVFGFGYDPVYGRTPYRLLDDSFTTTVFRQNHTVNNTRRELMNKEG